MSKKDVTKHGLLTIKGARKVSKYLSFDEILFIVQKFLGEHGAFPVTAPLLIDFSKKRDWEFRGTIFKIYSVCLIISGIVNLFLFSVLNLTSLSMIFMATLLMSLGLFFLNISGIRQRLLLRGVGPARGRFHIRSLKISIMIGLANNKEDLIKTIIHELDHYLWYLEYEGMDNSPVYSERLHEVRAEERASAWSRELDLVLK